MPALPLQTCGIMVNGSLYCWGEWCGLWRSKYCVYPQQDGFGDRVLDDLQAIMATASWETTLPPTGTRQPC